MAVYTPLTDKQLGAWARRFRLGALRKVRPVAGGTINTIYDLHTDKGRFILRILENRSQRDARFESQLLAHLEHAGLPVPIAMTTRRGESFVAFGPRQWVSVFRFMRGQELAPSQITTKHTRQVGQFLGTMHEALANLKKRRANAFSPAAIARLLKQSIRRAPDQTVQEAARRLANQLSTIRLPQSLPGTVVHGDLFVDNVRFQRGALVGVIDFEMASSGPNVYDLAVAICEWGWGVRSFSSPRIKGLLRGYQSVRPMTKTEQRALPRYCEFVCIRYATTRIFDFEVNAQPGLVRNHKDYRQCLKRLEALGKIDWKSAGLNA